MSHYCPTKSLYYYGVKFHIFSVRAKGTLPHVQAHVITPAS